MTDHDLASNMDSHGASLSRRAAVKLAIASGLMVGSATSTVAQDGAAGQGAPPDVPDMDVIAAQFALPDFSTNIAMELLVETGQGIDIGPGPWGYRRMVPITGGSFRGHGLTGIVLPGGADRQLIRRDGIRELDATYELRADDGTILMVRNRVIVDDTRKEENLRRYARSVVQVQAPDGPHAWLNRRILIGTLDSLRPQRPFVFLRFFVLD